jgi:hypothetical protein
MTCKHNWQFTDGGTGTLLCTRCGAVTGPRTYDQLVQDMLQDVTTTAKLTVPTGQLYALDTKPNYNITFHNNLNTLDAGKQVGKLDFNGPELVFEGDAAESAKVFIDWVAMTFHGRLKEEREAGRQEAEEVTWGVDWGRAGDKACVSIIKRLPDGRVEVVAVEYQP